MDETAPAVGPRTLLIGTALSVRQWSHALYAVEPRPILVGCLLADDANVSQVGHLPVRGTFRDLPDLLESSELEQVLVSLPATMKSATLSLARQLETWPGRWRVLGTLGDQLAGRNRAAGPNLGSRLDTDWLDTVSLINRKPRPLDEGSIRAALGGKVVLITGAGGSIGSQLARRVASFNPSKLLLVERSENALFEIDRELRRIAPDVMIRPLLHDVTDRSATLALMREHAPHAIFHAAAHKHVPMMETHPAQAVENNFYGTRSIADAAAAVEAERFAMVSTDKAVNPTSVMGATKRLAELYVQHLGRRSRTTYSMVRFGNVLGSACSVLPIWSKQLAEGGPITVTHADMQRYFMTIPEAAGLVLQSSALASGGEVFLLDMGEPIRILDLAERFVRTHGLEPNVDIAIEITGIRPGEKLFEELAYDNEDMDATPHASIHVWRTTPPSEAQMRQIIDTFDRMRDGGRDQGHRWAGVKPAAVVNALHGLIPEMVQSAAG